MKKKLILIIAAVIIAILTASITAAVGQNKTDDKLALLCDNAVIESINSFEQYLERGSQSDYIDGVAAFNRFMYTYLAIIGESDTQFTFCNELYGCMILNPEKTQPHVRKIIDALEYFVGDYDHPNGENLIRVASNAIIHGE